MKAKIRYRLILTFCLLTAFSMLLPVTSVTSNAASAKKKALKAYSKFLSSETISWEGSWSVSSANCSFAIAYVDNNSVPELIVENSMDNPHAAGYGILYTYKNGKVKKVANLELNGGTFIYYKKKGIFKDNYSQAGWFTTHIYKFSGKRASEKLIADINMAGAPANVSSVYYKVSGTKHTVITKSAYKKKLKSLTKSKKSTKAKFYKNTAAKRKQKLK